MSPKQIKWFAALGTTPPLSLCRINAQTVGYRTYKSCDVSLIASLNMMPSRTCMPIRGSHEIFKNSNIPKPTWIMTVSALQDPYLAAADEVEMSFADTLPALQLFIG